ncbi:MAG: CNNM domain-containing protein, partial [Chthoniobacterales bacterium]
MTVGLFVALIVVVAILIFFSAIFSGLETALFALKPHQLQRLENNQPLLREFVRLFRENPRRVLNLLLFGDGLVKVPLVVLCLLLLWRNPFAASAPHTAMVAITVFALI